MRKKGWIIAISTCLILAIAFSFLWWSQKKHNSIDTMSVEAKSGDLTRGEWMKVLCEEVGIQPSETQTYYFKDVTSDHPYFRYIQTAAEHEILEPGEEFCPDEYANSNFIALTALKGLGEYKFQIYYDMEQPISDAQYISFATENGLVELESGKEGMSVETAVSFLEQLDKVHKDVLWVDDYERIVYKKGVVQIADSDVVAYDPDANRLVLSGANDKITEGNILVFRDSKTDCMEMKKVCSVGTDRDQFLLEDTALSDGLESATVSSKDMVDLEWLYKALFHNEIPIDGQLDKLVFNVSLEQDDGDCKVVITDLGNGSDSLKTELPINGLDLSGVSELNAEVELSDITCYGQIVVGMDPKMITSFANDPVFAQAHAIRAIDCSVDMDAKVSGKVVVGKGKEKEIPILKEIPIPIGGGAASVDLSLFLFFNANGEIEVGMYAKPHMEFEYAGATLLRTAQIKRAKANVNVQDSYVTAAITLDAGIRPKVGIDLFRYSLADVSADIYGEFKAEEANYHDGEMVCQDFIFICPKMKWKVVALPGLKISFLEHEEELDLGSATIKRNCHYETVDGGERILVEKCTYQKKKDVIPEDGYYLAVYSENGEVDSMYTYYQDAATHTYASIQNGKLCIIGKISKLNNQGEIDKTWENDQERYDIPVSDALQLFYYIDDYKQSEPVDSFNFLHESDGGGFVHPKFIFKIQNGVVTEINDSNS